MSICFIIYSELYLEVENNQWIRSRFAHYAIVSSSDLIFTQRNLFGLWQQKKWEYCVKRKEKRLRESQSYHSVQAWKKVGTFIIKVSWTHKHKLRRVFDMVAFRTCCWLLRSKANGVNKKKGWEEFVFCAYLPIACDVKYQNMACLWKISQQIDV